MKTPWASFTLWQSACFTGIEEVAGVVAALGAVTSAVGEVAAGNAQSNAAKYNSEVDANNATQALQASQAQAAVSQQQTTQKLGEQAVAYGAGGVDVNTGSPVDVMTSTAAQGRLDAMTLRYGGQIAAQRDTQMGTLSSYTGAEAAAAGDLSAGSTVLTGAGKVDQATGYFGTQNSSSSSGTSSTGP
jgi:hypothetical protein